MRAAGRAALEALTDEGLAGVRRAVASGEPGGPLTVPAGDAAGVFAAELRLGFPGRDRGIARVHAAAGRLTGAGLEPDETATALPAVPGLAAAGLNQEGTPR